MPITLECKTIQILLWKSYIYSILSVTRRYGPEDTDYRNSKSEFAKIKFDIDAGKIKNTTASAFLIFVNTDFTPLFNWNTKQIFVTVVAEYQNKGFVSIRSPNKAAVSNRVI